MIEFPHMVNGKTAPGKINAEFRMFRSTLIMYSVLWFFCAAVLYLLFRIHHKSFLFLYDGLYQHFISFNYLCDYLKSIIVDHHFKGLYNYTLGQGMDIFTALNSYDFTDPVSAVSAAFVFLNRIQRYTLMIFIKLYLVGFSFCVYCRSAGYRNRTAVLIGAIAYTFSGATLFSFARHPNYINWAYFLPFLLAGVEYYQRRGKYMPLLIAVVLNIVTSYYTFYINAILTGIYVIVHALCRESSDLKRAFRQIMQIVMIFLGGILLSSVVMLPTIHAFLNNYRTGTVAGYLSSLWHYEKKFYLKVFSTLFVPFPFVDFIQSESKLYYTRISMNTLMFIPFLFSFTKKNRNTALKSLMIITCLMMSVPAVGRLMNGFGYASNRWTFVLVFYTSAALVEMYDTLKALDSGGKRMLAAGTILYTVLCFLCQVYVTYLLALIGLAMIVFTAAAYLLTVQYRNDLFDHAMVALVLIGAVYQTVFVFSPYGGNYLFYFQDEALAEQSLNDYSSRAALNADDGFYRVEMEENRTNVDGYLGINGTRLWWSVIPSSTTEYYMDLALDTVRYNCDIYGLDTRTGLLELAGVRYYTRPAAEDGIIPYGYDETASTDPKYQVFENKYALPVGYTYSGYISEEEYEQLNGIEKEQALLQAAVLEEKNLPLPEAVIEQPMEQLTFEPVSFDHAEWSGNELISSVQGGQITLAVDVPENCELYLYLKNIHLQGESTNVKISAGRSIDGLLLTEKTALITTEAFYWPVIRDDAAFNLGYGHDGLNTITLTISEEARFSIDDIEIYAVPMSSYEKYVGKLGEYVLEDIAVGEDQISGQIFVSEPRILQFAIPYSIGWKAYVDGTETEVLRSGGMYMAVLLDAGKHSVELRYAMPYLKTGFVISLAVLLYLAGSAFMKKKGRKS